MTGANDGDVDRALAAFGATSLKYHSFGGLTVRPPGSEAAPPGLPSFGFPSAGGSPAALPPSGEGTAAGYRAHAASSVFPLLGLALPEAFHIDVEPEWPVGPPVSAQGVFLDPVAPYGVASAGLPLTSPQRSAAVPSMAPVPDGTPGLAAAAPHFTMPPWLPPADDASALAAPWPETLSHGHTNGREVAPTLPVWSEAPVHGQVPFSPFLPSAASSAMPGDVQAGRPAWLDQLSHAAPPHAAPQVTPLTTDWTLRPDGRPDGHYEAPAARVPVREPLVVVPPPPPMPMQLISASAPPPVQAQVQSVSIPPQISPQAPDPVGFAQSLPMAEGLHFASPNTWSQPSDPSASLDHSHFAQTRITPPDGEPIWHEPPMMPAEPPLDHFADPRDAPRYEAYPAPYHDPVPPGFASTGFVSGDGFSHSGPADPPAATTPARRPLADLFRTLGAGGPSRTDPR